jgi:shikimate dehydrogenase
VLGSPIAHSLSPVLHRAAYGALDLDWDYTAVEVTEPELAGFLDGLDGSWRGLSLTMPLKRAVIDLCDEVESRGRLLESVNTVVFDEHRRRWGYNTDVVGMVAAFRHAGVRHLDTAMVVGAGATAASALAAAAELGAHQVTVLARSVERAGRLLKLADPLRLSVEVHGFDHPDELPATDAVISTIPAAGQYPELAEKVLVSAPVLFDVVYHPRVTPFLAGAASRQMTTVGGFELLLHQAARQVELMTGESPAPVAEMRAAGLEALEAPA